MDRLCKPYGFYKNECLPIKYDSMVAMTKNDIINGLINELLEDLLNENKIDIYKEDDAYKYQITSSFNQKIRKYENLSIIDLNKCEEELKSKYNINQNETLLIFKYDYIQKDLLVPIVGYEVYHPITKENLDLNYCEQKINIIVPAEIKENELYKNNPNSFYYKDKCNSYPNGNGVDMTIYNRKSEYNQRY